MKKIISIVETGQWQLYPDIAKMSIEQIEIMRKTVGEMEYLGLNKNPPIVN